MFIFRYWAMHDVMDEALQRLYWACREGRGFPGVIPDESSGRVSANAILRGLGLDPPAVERSGPVKSHSDSLLDGVDVRSERSYHPPDMPQKLTPRPSIQSTEQTPHSSKQDGDMADGTDGADGVDGADSEDDVDGVSDSDEVHSRPQEMSTQHPGNGIPAGVGQQSRQPPEDPIDLPMTQGASMRMMNMHSPMYTRFEARGFQTAAQLDGQSGPPSMQIGQQRHGSMQGNVFGSAGQAGWTAGQPTGVDGETLPWPGNLAALYRDAKGPGGSGESGFKPPNRRR
ncbi:hypothetical protein LTR34_001071 [Exophiala xenobiotica]|uniref:Uncharacterized protein n=1 Tax=Vermiconidia calcicola TaxID=1690605 RepID=A0AAV9QNH7_9PEZI|nr:hypothetical protein LTR34_001071 [Exophiala xenobiotica]KAK5534866.1 hypothetical protein LTR23_008662 [Chaetothyriales sp. CCFEE 6169]KAK5545564.1 hypothetical protein LTR25_000571 [Vermiconidia calcicola]KAK5556101.1 hypothetical protein LTR46_005947 [Exophiala xenobiotica]